MHRWLIIGTVFHITLGVLGRVTSQQFYLHSLYSLHRLTTATIYWKLVCPMSHDKSMRCSSLPETEAYATFQKFHASNRSLPLDDSRTQVKIYCLCMQLGSILPSQDRSSLRRMAYAWAF